MLFNISIFLVTSVRSSQMIFKLTDFYHVDFFKLIEISLLLFNIKKPWYKGNKTNTLNNQV